MQLRRNDFDKSRQDASAPREGAVATCVKFSPLRLSHGCTIIVRSGTQFAQVKSGEASLLFLV